MVIFNFHSIGGRYLSFGRITNVYRTILGKLEKIDPRNGLCEHSAEGTFMSGLLEGKVRLVIT